MLGSWPTHYCLLICAANAQETLFRTSPSSTNRQASLPSETADSSRQDVAPALVDQASFPSPPIPRERKFQNSCPSVLRLSASDSYRTAVVLPMAVGRQDWTSPRYVAQLSTIIHLWFRNWFPYSKHIKVQVTKLRNLTEYSNFSARYFRVRTL